MLPEVTWIESRVTNTISEDQNQVVHKGARVPRLIPPFFSSLGPASPGPPARADGRAGDSVPGAFVFLYFCIYYDLLLESTGPGRYPIVFKRTFSVKVMTFFVKNTHLREEGIG